MYVHTRICKYKHAKHTHTHETSSLTQIAHFRVVTHTMSYNCIYMNMHTHTCNTRQDAKHTHTHETSSLTQIARFGVMMHTSHPGPFSLVSKWSNFYFRVIFDLCRCVRWPARLLCLVGLWWPWCMCVCVCVCVCMCVCEMASAVTLSGWSLVALVCVCVCECDCV